MKQQVLLKALTEDIVQVSREEMQKKRKLTLHINEIIMRRKQFDIVVEQNRGKSLNLTYDKRKILNPMVAYDDVVMIDTLPFGHEDLGLYKMTAAAMELVCEEDV